MARPVADLAGEEAPEVVVDLGVLAQQAVPARLPPLAQREVVAELAGEEVSLEALHRSFSPEMVGNFRLAGTPRCSPAPRSARKAKRHP